MRRISFSGAQDEVNTLESLMERTKVIHQMIEILHEDILQLKHHSNKDIIDNLSFEEKTILKLATEYLIQVIMATKINKHPNNSGKESKNKSQVID